MFFASARLALLPSVAHLRQHERLTRADSEVTERVQILIRGTPTVRHLAYPVSKP
jgi:hypothetical protein